MKSVFIAFSDKGIRLADMLSRKLGGRTYRSGQDEATDFREWVERQFSEADNIVFVGAVGIAVRSIAPFVKDKAVDPAVVVIDERALHVIPVLSGHLGGANDLSRKISKITGSDCVITTATDINGIFAVDEWARYQKFVLVEKEKIVKVSGKLLRGDNITVYSRWPVMGDPPEGVELVGDNADKDHADVVLDIRTEDTEALHLVPEVCVLGIGCRKGTPAETIEKRLGEFIGETGIDISAIGSVATIDLKEEEQGLIDFCKKHAWSLITCTVEDLRKVPGEFSPSEFVKSVTGVDNVCERSAVCVSKGRLIECKSAGNGVTLALAERAFAPDWKWKSEDKQ